MSRMSLTKSDVVEFAIQTWRLQRRVEGMDPEKHKREYRQFSDSVRRFVKFLDRFDVEFEDPTGKPFTTGWLEVEVVRIARGQSRSQAYAPSKSIRFRRGKESTAGLRE